MLFMSDWRSLLVGCSCLGIVASSVLAYYIREAITEWILPRTYLGV